MWRLLPCGRTSGVRLRDVLLPIDIAVIQSHANAEARQRLEERLLEVLESDAPRAAKDYVCRQLCAMGTARSVPALAALLDNAELAHMARAALEDIPGEEATAALHDAVKRLQGDLQIGAIHSLGSRGDSKSVPLLLELLHNEDARVAGACLAALSRIPTSDAAATAAVTAYLEQTPVPARPGWRPTRPCALPGGCWPKVSHRMRPPSIVDSKRVTWSNCDAPPFKDC